MFVSLYHYPPEGRPVAISPHWALHSVVGNAVDGWVLVLTTEYGSAIGKPPALKVETVAPDPTPPRPPEGR